VIRQLLLRVSFMAAVAASAPLEIGDVMPTLSGRTLSDKLIDLPAASASVTRLVVFSFSKAASGDSRLWTEHVAEDARLRRFRQAPFQPRMRSMAVIVLLKID